jgi:hypothetical protein
MGWTYTYSNSQIKNLHILQNNKNKNQKAFLKREISVLRPDEKISGKKFLNRRCPKLSEKMKVKIDYKGNSCVHVLEMNGIESTVYSFLTKRKSKANNSFFWNTISFQNTKNYKINQNIIRKLRSELEKNLY